LIYAEDHEGDPNIDEGLEKDFWLIESKVGHIERGRDMT